MNTERFSHHAALLCDRIEFAMKMERRCWRMFKINIVLMLALMWGCTIMLFLIEAPHVTYYIVWACAAVTFIAAYRWSTASMRALDLAIHATDRLQKTTDKMIADNE